MTRAVPIAVAGMAGFFPGAADLESFWARLLSGEKARALCTIELESPVEAVFAPIDLPPIDLARFGIPPAFARALPRIHVALLAAAEAALRDAGLEGDRLPRDAADVVCGTSFSSGRIRPNTLRIDAPRAIDLLVRAALVGPDAARALQREADLACGGSFHDKLYEMGSTVASQISQRFRLRGRSMTIDALDLTSFAALRAAMESLRSGDASLALVVCGQLLDDPLLLAGLAAKGLGLGPEVPPLSARGQGYVLGEAVVAVVLQRLDDALRSGGRIRAVLAGLGMAHDSEPGPFRYGRDHGPREAAAASALREAEAEPGAIAFLECFGSSFPEETAREMEALAGVYAPAGEGRLAIGSVKELVGHTFAAGGLASLAKLVLALERSAFPPQRFADGVPPMSLAGTPFRFPRAGEPWPPGAGGGPRRAALAASGLGGGHAHLVLEERPRAPARPGPPRAPAKGTPIAVVGAGAVFPGGTGLEEFWQAVLEGRDLIRPVPPRVLDRRIYFDPSGIDPLKTYTELAAWIEEPELDAGRFRIVPRRLEAMDRATRLALVLAARALGDRRAVREGRRALVALATSFVLGGHRRAEARLAIEETLGRLGSSAVLAALPAPRREEALREVRDSICLEKPEVGPFTLDGVAAGALPLLVSNALGLDAPAVAVQAACASTLASVDLACRGLALGTCDLAVAGGVELGVSLHDLVLCSRMKLLSPTRIRPFDEAADGFSIGEGGAVYLLERLEDALAAGDPVLAVVRAIGASSDARSLVAPDAGGQEIALERAFERVDFGPDDVDFLEAHGTGTSAGDPIEIEAIRRVYGTGTRRRALVLGSVKSSIGHAMAAAGAAGILQAILALRSRTFPPLPFLRRIQPELALDAIPARLLASAEPWPDPPGPRRAAVSSFGTGGIDYHLLLEEAPARR